MLTPSTRRPLARCLCCSCERWGKALRQGPHLWGFGGRGGGRVAGGVASGEGPATCSPKSGGGCCRLGRCSAARMWAGLHRQASAARPHPPPPHARSHQVAQNSITMGPCLEGTATGSPLMNVSPAASKPSRRGGGGGRTEMKQASALYQSGSPPCMPPITSAATALTYGRARLAHESHFERLRLQ